MANQQHVNILRQGIAVWSDWRNKYPNIQANLSAINLSGADLRGIDLEFANLIGTNLSKTNLQGSNLSRAILNEADLHEADLSQANFLLAYLFKANLSQANLQGADLQEAELFWANLSRANLQGANLFRAKLNCTDLREADLRGSTIVEANLRSAKLCGAKLSKVQLDGSFFFDADLSGANLSEARLMAATLVNCNLKGTNLRGCSVYGASAWNNELDEGTIQSNLIITSVNEPAITVDNLEVAQFIYLLLNNQKIRDVIDTIGQKGVLILGRFSQERKTVLDALREKLRTLNFLPIVFDFERSTERDFTETIMTLADLSCFIIADITNPKSSPLELQATVPNYMIPFVPIIQEGEEPFSMFKDLRGKYNWVLDPLVYDTCSNLIKVLERAVVEPALEKRAELLAKKMEQLRARHIGDYL